MEHFIPTDLAPYVAALQMSIALTASGVVCLMHKFAPKRHTIRLILILMVIGSAWSSLANFQQGSTLYLGVFVFMVSVLAMLIWVIYFHVWVLPNKKDKDK